MESIDLSKTWTPEMVAYKNGKGCRSSGHTVSEETRQKISKTLLGSSGGMLGKTHSEEARRNMSEAHMGIPLSEECREHMSEARMGHPTSEEARKRISEALLGNTNVKTYLAGLTLEENMARVRNSFLSAGAMRRSSISNHVSPSWPEWFVGLWIGRNHPTEWAYTGDRKSMELLRSKGYAGLKVPDFFNINGLDAVMEILGGLGHWHEEKEEAGKIAYYKEHGLACLVLFEEDCYDYDRLEAKYTTTFGIPYEEK